MCDGRCGLGPGACPPASGAGALGLVEGVAVVPVDGCEPGDADGADAASGVSRRDFLSRSTLAAVAALLASACGTGADILAARNRSGAGTLGAGGITLQLASFPALAQVGGIARADTVAGPIALVRTSQSAIAAFSMICPHQGSTINIQGSGFLCPNHGARFDAAGQWTGGQPTSNLASYPVTFDATTGVMTVGAGGTGPGTFGNGTIPVNLVIDLASFPALATVGGVARVDGGSGVPVGAVRTSASQFAAYTLACTHQGTTVRLSGTTWICPNHGAQFNASGAVVRGPATVPLQALTAAYDSTSNRLTITGTASSGGRRGDDD